MKAKERMHLSKVAELGCIACLNLGHDEVPAEIHHIKSGGVGLRASNFEVIGLCHTHHRTGGHGVAIHAGRKTWEGIHGTESQLLDQVMEMIK